MNDAWIRQITELRKKLHEIPETALQEKKTKACLLDFLRQNSSLQVMDRESWFYALWPGKDGAGTENTGGIVLRADFDAVAGADGNPGHYCGHDGHAAILAGVACYLSERQPNVPVYLLFQPAEETGQGALLCRELLEEIKPDGIFGLHNIPGFSLGSVLTRYGTFACASTGLEIRLVGTPSHAAYPEAGANPALSVSNLTVEINKFLSKNNNGVLMSTVIGIDLGSAAYGVSASEGTLRLTLRGEKEKDFDRLVSFAKKRAHELAKENGLTCSAKEIERFPATENTDRCVDMVRDAAREAGLELAPTEEPFRWSEDFGAYLQICPGAFFGIGDGETYPQLHTAGYCFPDAVVEPALAVWIQLIENYEKSQGENA